MINVDATNSSLEICEVLAAVTDKFVVDFANGIDVVRDHVRVQTERTGFFARMYDRMTGHAHRRQTAINASLADGVQGSLIWLTELSTSLATSNFAIARVNERVALIQNSLTTLTHYSADTREQLNGLSRTLNARCDMLAKELARIDGEQRAERQLEQVCNKWAAGRFAMYAPAARCYAALEELYWGNFGDFCRTNTNHVREGFMNDLVNRAIGQLVSDTDLDSARNRIPVTHWTVHTGQDRFIPDAYEALSYLGDWAESDAHPFVFSTSQRPSELPLGLPRLCSAERVADALVTEVFERRAP